MYIHLSTLHADIHILLGLLGDNCPDRSLSAKLIRAIDKHGQCKIKVPKYPLLQTSGYTFRLSQKICDTSSQSVIQT
jgi:hypothetical protein